VVEVRSEGDHCLLSVKDRGEGVEPDRVETLFDRFSQGKKRGRAGLGLHFCKIMADRWGGEIGYSLRQRGGSSFWLRLPAVSS
jgi:signal transduction histidine kinase